MTKKNFLVSAVIALMIFLVGSFSACNLKDLGKPKAEPGEKEITVIVENEEFTISTNAEYLHQVLIDLSREKGFQYSYSDMGYGVSVTQIKNIKTSTDWSSWVSIYHDIDDVTLVDNYGTFRHAGKDYFMSLVSIDLLPVLDGHTYLFEQSKLS